MGIVRKEDIHSTFDNYIRDMHSNPNLLINGDFQVWQRGESFTNISNQYTADRWKVLSNKAKVNIVHEGHSAKITTTDLFVTNFWQVIETPTGIRNNQVTLSFMARATQELDLLCSVGIGNDFDNAANRIDKLVHITTEANKKYSVTFDIPNFTVSDNVVVVFRYADFIGDIWFSQCKLELGSVLTPFVPRSFGEELALCQRYYEVIDRVFRTTSFTLGDGMFAIEYPFLVEKRVPPTVVLPSDKTELIEVVGARNSTPTNLECFTTIGGVRFTGVLANDANRIVGLNFRTYADAEIY